MNTVPNNEEKFRLTNIVGETKKMILDEPENKKHNHSEPATDEEIRKAVEMINPDPNSMKNWG